MRQNSLIPQHGAYVMAYEHLSPQHHATFLYDELAWDIREAYLPLLDSTHTSIPKATFDVLIERIIAALRHDNALFNEARFRHSIVHGQASRPRLRNGKLPPGS